MMKEVEHRIVKRNLITGHYHFYDNHRGVLNSLLQEKSIRSMKTKIEELLYLSEVS